MGRLHGEFPVSPNIQEDHMWVVDASSPQAIRHRGGRLYDQGLLGLLAKDTLDRGSNLHIRMHNQDAMHADYSLPPSAVGGGVRVRKNTRNGSV
jgi:hypothetical protein